jgi:hypothetical protein
MYDLTGSGKLLVEVRRFTSTTQSVLYMCAVFDLLLKPSCVKPHSRDNTDYTAASGYTLTPSAHGHPSIHPSIHPVSVDTCSVSM